MKTAIQAFDTFKSDLTNLLPSISSSSEALQETVKDVMETLNQAEEVQDHTTEKAEQLFSQEISSI